MAWTNASLIAGFTTQNTSIDVPAIRLETYCERHDVQSVDLVKIDVEGAEIKVLQGMRSLLERWQPDIICEVLEPYQDQINAFFHKKPYRKFLIAPEGLIEVDTIRAHPQFRDYYLSCQPPASLL
jgi:hypothetical protein